MAAYTFDTVYTVYTVDTVDIVYTVMWLKLLMWVMWLTRLRSLTGLMGLIVLMGLIGLMGLMRLRMNTLFYFDCLGHKELKNIAYDRLWEPYAVTVAWMGRIIPNRLLHLLEHLRG